MKTIDVTIVGISPLLVNRFSEEAEQAESTRRQLVVRGNPRDQASKAAYIAPDGTYYFSAVAIQRAMMDAGASHKMKGSRKSVKWVVPSAVLMTTEAVTICDGNGAPAKSFEVDSRPVNIPSTKGRIMRHRPKFNEWSAHFDLVIDELSLPIELAHQLLNEAGQFQGIGDYRPSRTGVFGRFRVTDFNERVSKSKD